MTNCPGLPGRGVSRDGGLSGQSPGQPGANWDS